MINQQYILNFMAKHTLFFFLFFVGLCQININAQQKLIGYRHNDYYNNNWLGIDSMLFDYNNGGDTLWHFAIKGDSQNGWKNNFRYTFQWDANHHRTYQLREKSNGMGGWQNDNQYFYTYDGSGNLTEVVYQIWNNGWQNNGHLTFSGYNSFNKPANILTESWNGAVWSPVASNDKSYVNSQYLLQYDSYFYWDGVSSSWKKINRKYYTYLQDSISSIQVSVPDSIGNWKGSTKEVRAYNLSNMLLTSVTNQLFDTAQNLQDVNRYKYTYSGTNKISMVEYQLPAGTLWNTTKRTNYVYDSNDSLSLLFSEVNTGAWENDKKTEYTLNLGKITEERHYDGAASSWAEAYKINYTYDANSNKTYALWSNYSGSSYSPVKEEFFYYNQYPLGLSSFSQQHLTIYPNPAKEEVCVEAFAEKSEMITFKLYDMLGNERMRMIQPLSSGRNLIHIPLANVADGSYILRAGNNESEGNMIVVKH